MSKDKHDHKITKNIKAILFAFLMFLPVLSVVSTSLYTIFNDNAYQSYDGKETYLQAELKTQTNAVNSLNDIKTNNYYMLEMNPENQIDQTIELFNIELNYNAIEIIKIETSKNNDISIIGKNIKSISYADITFGTENNKRTISVYMNNTNNEALEINTSNNLQIITKVLNKTDIAKWELFHELPTEYYEYTAIQKERYTLNNAFDKAFNELENNKMFSWTKDTIIYDGVYNTLNLLQVKNNTLVVLISYWLYLTTIYIIIDIIIESIVFLTHMINVKADKD
ncbi:MAG: hypothetical protein SO148_06790 [Candidatus Onthovivens sp.]|nr:hypothetical protein [Candidatus Onthovivens sp.]